MTQRKIDTAVALIEHFEPEIDKLISDVAEEFGMGIAMTVSSNIAINMLHTILNSCKDENRKVEVFVAISKSLLSGISDEVLDASIKSLLSGDKQNKH